ncbi:MAG: response regulator transcription factor [Dehalococcoidia bacterium]
MEEKVLVVEDDREQAGLLQEWLLREGYEARISAAGGDAVRQFHDYRPSLILLDIVIPGLDGWSVLRHVKEASETPVIVVTGAGGNGNMVKALNMGADDYITKPVERQVLLAKMRAVLRRYPDKGTQPGGSFKWNGLEVDFQAHRVFVDGREVSLSPTEFRLLTCLVKNAGTVVGHRDLLLNVWGSGYLNGKEYLKLYIRYLRLKLEKNPETPQLIKTIRGIGYCFEAAQPEPPAAPSTPGKAAQELGRANSLFRRIRHPLNGKALITPR